MNTENYAIVNIRSWYGANDTLNVYDGESFSNDLEDYEQLSMDEACEIVAAEDNATHYLAHNEAGRARLLIVHESTIRQIIDIQHDCSSADWSDYEGEDDDAEAVGDYIQQQILEIARAGEVEA